MLACQYIGSHVFLVPGTGKSTVDSVDLIGWVSSPLLCSWLCHIMQNRSGPCGTFCSGQRFGFFIMYLEAFLIGYFGVVGVLLLGVEF